MGAWVLREEGRAPPAPPGAPPSAPNPRASQSSDCASASRTSPVSATSSSRGTQTCFPTQTSLAYHPGLNVLFVARNGHVKILDVNSGALLHQASPGGDLEPIGIQYLAGSDRIVFWNKHALGVRSDYNGVLLLHTVLQQPVYSANTKHPIKIELFLSEAILLYQCMKSIELSSVECASDVLKALGDAIDKANELPKKGIKAQKWSTVCLELPYISLKVIASTIVMELKKQKRHVPALAIASALNQQVSDLMPSSTSSSQSSQELMFSEATRRETFKKWPHMDYKWALPAQMAQAGFFYQPAISGDDRAMCFVCLVCLVCWEKTDEPWSEHERHSPDCALVKGEYTHNVPLSVTYATSPAVSHPRIAMVSKGNSGDIFLTGTTAGKVSIWNVDCKLKLQQEFFISVDEPLLQGKLYGPYSSVRKAWSDKNTNDSKLALKLTSLAIVGRCQNKDQPCSKNISSTGDEGHNEKQCLARPSIVCGVKINTGSASGKTVFSIWNDTETSMELKPSDSSAEKNVMYSIDGIKAMNDQNQAKSNNSVINSSYLVVYDFQGKCAQTVSPLTNGNGNLNSKNGCSKSGGSKKCGDLINHICRTEDANFYDDIYFPKYMCLDEDLSQEMALVAGLPDQVTVIDLKGLVGNKEIDSKFNQSIDSNAKSSSASNNNSKHPLQKCIQFISKVNIANSPQSSIAIHPILDSQGYKTEQHEVEPAEKLSKPIYNIIDIEQPEVMPSNETDALILDTKIDEHCHELACIAELMYEYKNSGIKMKMPYCKPSTAKNSSEKPENAESSNEESSRKEEPSLPPVCRAVQCLQLPPGLSARSDLTITHVLPTNEGDHLLVVVTCESVTDEESAPVVNGTTESMEHDGFECGTSNINPPEVNIYNNQYVKLPTSFFILYSLKFDSFVTLINESPFCIKEISYGETPLDICLLPKLEKSAKGLGLAATVGRDGSLRLIEISNLETISKAEVDLKFVSLTFCTSLEKLCACTEKGTLYFYSVRDNEGDSNEELDEEDTCLNQSEQFISQNEANVGLGSSQINLSANQTNLIAHKTNLDDDDFANLVKLAGIDGKGDNVVGYGAVVSNCWCELLPTQRSRSDNQHFYRSWRLQNTSTTWDEHVLELTLPWNLSISHVEFKFSLHAPCTIPPNIQVTLLKQHLLGMGHRKDSSKNFVRIDDQIDFNLIESESKGIAENPVRSKEYLRAHNAEILAGPLSLSHDLDLTQQGGTLTLTSPRLYRARGRTLLIHIKTLFDPSKDINQGKVSSSKKTKLSDNYDGIFAPPGSTVERFVMPSAKKKVESYIGCDWLHEISITVFSNTHTDIPQERLQRIAMLESNFFFENLLNIASKSRDKEKQAVALDLLIWIVSVRLTRFRNVKTEIDPSNAGGESSNQASAKNFNNKVNIETLQHETVKSIQKNTTNLIKNCILLSKRSIAKKCVKLILICCKGAKNLDSEASLQFEMAILESVTICLPLIGVVHSAGSLSWFTQLVKRSIPLDFEMRCATTCMQLLKDVASLMQTLYNPYHLLLRSRFGLYGLPMESSLFDIELPALGKTLSVPLTYASVAAGETNPTQNSTQHDIDLRDLYNYSGKNSTGWWCSESSVCGNVSGLSEVMPLRVILHNSSDGTLLDTATAQQSSQSIFSINTDHSQFWDMMTPKDASAKDSNAMETDASKALNAEMNQNDKLDCSLMECDTSGEFTKPEEENVLPESPSHQKDAGKLGNGGSLIPWQLLVQQPPQQTFVIKRMHPGARNFIVLDFGQPVKLTDVIFPSCSEIMTLSIDVWLTSEDRDCVRIILSPDISTKNLVMTDIQPAPVCQYLKITTIARYNMSSTKCKIPLGWFFGEIADFVFYNEPANATNLISFHQDLLCRFRLAVGKLTDCLDFYLEMFGGSASHMTADADQQSDSNSLVRSTYQECLELQQQITIVENIMEKFNIFNKSECSEYNLDDLGKHSSLAILKQSSVDKLKTITEQLTDILLHICYECDSTMLKRLSVNMSMSTCNLVTKWLIVCSGGGSPRLEAGLASVLVRLCSSQPWWGAFIADTLSQLYSPSNTLIFSQNRVLILLVYMGRKSILFSKSGTSGYGGVVECVSQLVARLLPPADTTLPTDPVWQTSDLALLGWLLIYLSACLDTAQPKEGSLNAWMRWNFLSGGNGNNSGNNAAGNNGNVGKGSGLGSIVRFHRRKMQKRLVHKVQAEELEAVRKAYQVSQQVQALSALSSQAASLTQHLSNINTSNILQSTLKNQDSMYKPVFKHQWVKRFEDFLQHRISTLNKRVSGHSSAMGNSSRQSGSGASTSTDHESSSSDGRPTHLISQQLALQVSRSLISLILSMDFTCNTDVLLLSCKVIGRLNGICGGLSNVVKEHEVLELMRAACSPAPWHQHALLMLLQDLVEYDRTGSRSSYPSTSDAPLSPLPLIQTDAAEENIQWNTQFANSDNRSDPIPSDVGAAPSNDDGAAASGSIDYSQSPIIESDEDFDLDDLLEEMPDKIRNLNKDVIPKPPNNQTPNGSSIAIDARLSSGIEISGEVLVRQLALLGGGSLAAAIHSQPIPSNTSVNPAPPVEVLPPPTGDLTNMLICSFHTLFTELELQDNSNYLERVLLLWITMNGCSCGVSLNNATSQDALLMPKIKLSSQAVISIIHALNQQLNIPIRCWVLAFQCLSWVSNSPSNSPITGIANPEGMAGVMLEDPQFIEMLVKFLSSNMEGEIISHGGERSCAGPVACTTMACLLQRISARAPATARNAFLKALCQLTAPSGALRNGRGPSDAQRELLRVATPYPCQYTSAHLPEAMSLIESIGVIINLVGNPANIEIYGIGEPVSSVSSVDLSGGVSGSFGGLLAEALGVPPDVVRRERPATRRDLIISLMVFARSLILIPLRDVQAGENPNPDESQTDESKASQQHSSNMDNSVPSTSSAPPKIPCLADTVLQHYPTMKRIFKALSTSSLANVLFVNSTTSCEISPNENMSFGEALFKFAITLVQTATHPRLILTPLLDYLVHGSLSEALVRFILRTLEFPEAPNIFVQLGGVEIICSRLIASHKSQLSPQPGLVAALMNHLKQPSQLINLSTANSTNPEKAQQANPDMTEGLLNYAPLGIVTSSNPTAQQADALLTVLNNGGGNCGGGGGGGAHRRTRSATWVHHFGRGETSIDLSIKLPHAILLHEVQLQPHLSTLYTCPSAVSLEICSQGSVMTPLGPPQPTAGMTYIRLKLANPLVVSYILLRLYRPRDNSNLGLLNIRILGTAAFTAPINDKADEKLAASSAGWAVLLWSVLWGPENTSYLEARQRASSIPGLPEATTGLLFSAIPPSATLRSLILALGSERSTALRVLTLILHNAHIPAHQGYQQTVANTKSASDCICDLLYRLCVIRDVHSSQRIKTFIDRLKNCGLSMLSHARQRSSTDTLLPSASHGSKYLSPAYIQCFASILWSVNEQQTEFNLKDLITPDLFDIVYDWIEILPKFATVKRSLNSVLCSLCYIKPELFTRMLQRMKVLVPDTSSEPIVVEASISDDRKDLEARVAVTDDIKVHRGSNLILKPAALEDLTLSPSQLMTISIACMSPNATKVLLKSNLLISVTRAIKTFCLQQNGIDQGSSSLTDSDKSRRTDSLISLEMMPVLVEWLSNLCIDADIKNWLGSPVGSVFWKPLLMILCLPLPTTKNWHKNEFYTQLEEKTIKLFGALVLCHLENQKLFAKTLYDVIKCHPESASGNSPVSGFTRGLLLRLLLRNERISVAIRIKGNNQSYFKDANTTFVLRCTSTSPLSPKYLASHPSLYGCVVVSLPHQTQLSDIISQYRLYNGNTWATNEPNTNTNNIPKKPTPNVSFGDSGSNSQSCTGAIDAWELSVAAANTAKDKRTKDARNLCAKQAMMLHCKKKSSAQRGSSSNKKDEFPINCPPSLFHFNNKQDSLLSIKVLVDGLDGHVSLDSTLGSLYSAVSHKFGSQLNLSIVVPFYSDPKDLVTPLCMLSNTQPPTSLLNVFVSVGGLALLAHHLPPVSPPLPLSIQPSKDSANTDEWVKLDDVYEDVAEAGSNSTNDESSSLIPAHSLFALGLLLRLPGYAEALLKEGQKAVYLLRLLLGVTDDGEGKDIMAVCGSGLGTLSFKVLGSLLESLPLSTDDGMLLRSTLLQSGTLRLLLVCLAVFTHQQPDSPPSETTHSNGAFSKAKGEEKSKLYWAKGTGFGTGSTQQSWNVEESLLKQKTEEEHVTVLLQVIASYIQPGEKWNVGEQIAESSAGKDSGSSSDMETQNPCLPPDFITIIHQSVLLPAISSYLRNDSVLDMSRHIPLYLAVMRVVRAVMTTQALCSHSDGSSVPVSSLLTVIPQLLHQMSCTVDTYAKKLKMNKKTAFGKSYNQKTTNSNNEGCEDDEGLALLIPDIQATSALIQHRLGMSEENRGLMNTSLILRAPSTATREARYLEVMKRLQFETFEIIGECPDNGFKFNVPYHFESTVRAAGENSHPARMKRLAQEAVTLSTSLPLSYSSSVFVRTDQDRLDVMKVLITGPSDTPYANGCFELDVYFPMDYPNTPMLINLETTGRHSVRFNPNLYLDGKVCLSVLNTWHGRPEEQWNAQTSSFLQVLVSIQSLILVPEPYFNEPGFERSRGTPGGTHHSLEYNSNIYQACVRWAMLEQLRNPTSCFQQVIQTHFWLKRDEICTVIEGWIEELEKQAGDKRTQRNIRMNMIALKRHYKHLREELAKLTVPPGLEDLETPFSAACATQDSSAPLASPICVPDQQNQDMEVDMDQLIKKIVSEAFE